MSPKPERLWYRTYGGKRWHLMGSQVPSGLHGWTICGTLVRWDTGSNKHPHMKRDLCQTCVSLDKRPR